MSWYNCFKAVSVYLPDDILYLPRDPLLLSTCVRYRPWSSSPPNARRTARLIACADEPEEVEVVEQQLTEHLDMDPTVTLGVLCDQVAPQDEAADEEEQAIRDRLRGLVLSFMTGKAKRGIMERHANTHKSPAEVVLVQGMYRVRPIWIIMGWTLMDSDHSRPSRSCLLRMSK